MGVRVARNALIRLEIEPLTSESVVTVPSALSVLRKIWAWTGG